MNTRSSYILIPIFLATLLLFSQVGVGFFHDKHNAHERIDQAHKDQTQLYKHGEHCIVCAVDLFSSLFIGHEVVTINNLPRIITECTARDALQSLTLRFFEGRAPPILAI